MIDTKERYEAIKAMSKPERESLDGLCAELTKIGKPKGIPVQAMADRIVALACVELYHQWQIELFERE